MILLSAALSVFSIIPPKSYMSESVDVMLSEVGHPFKNYLNKILFLSEVKS